MPEQDQHQQLAIGVKAAARLIGISPASVYVLLNDGKLRAGKCNGRTLIRRADIEAFLASMPPFRPKPTQITLKRKGGSK